MSCNCIWTPHSDKVRCIQCNTFRRKPCVRMCGAPTSSRGSSLNDANQAHAKCPHLIAPTELSVRVDPNRKCRGMTSVWECEVYELCTPYAKVAEYQSCKGCERFAK